MVDTLKINVGDHFSGWITCLYHFGNENKAIQFRKANPYTTDMFRRTIFKGLVDVDVVFNIPLLHNLSLTLREVMGEKPYVTSF